MKKYHFSLLLVLTFSLLLAGCDFDGGVEQGRCVAFDPAAKTLKLVVDTTLDPANPHYSGGVHSFTLPTDPRDMGPEPVAGGLLMVEIEKSSVLLYDAASNGLKKLNVTFTDVEKNITAKHPKVKDKTFPVINKEQKSITTYVPRLATLVTFTVPDEALQLPQEMWVIGHEMRIAFRNENKTQAIRIMNVTKTDIFKK